MSRWTLILIFLIFLSGCGVFKNRRNVSEIYEINQVHTLADIRNFNITKSGFYIQKAEIKITDEGNERKLLGSLKFNPPGKYLFSFKSLTGIEAARIMITKDTLLINDRINRKLFYGSPDNIGKKYGITFGMLPLFLGDILDNKLIGDSVINCRNGIGQTESNVDNKKVYFEIDCKKSKIAKADFLNEEGNEGLKFRMEKIVSEEGMYFPKLVEIEDYNKSTTIEIKIGKIKFDGEEDIVFVPGRNYEKILLK